MTKLKGGEEKYQILNQADAKIMEIIYEIIDVHFDADMVIDSSDVRDVIRDVINKIKKETLTSYIEWIEGEKKEIHYEELDTGIGIDKLKYDGQEKEEAHNQALTSVQEKLKKDLEEL